MPDARGSWFRVYSRQVIIHPKFRVLTHAELGVWLTLRAEADLLGGMPFPDRRAALQALGRRTGATGRALDRLVALRLVDVSEDGSFAIHDLADHDRPFYPSDSPQASRERQRKSRAVSRVVTSRVTSVTNGVTTAAHARGETEERRGREEAEKNARAEPDANDPLTIICQLLNSAAPIEDRKYRTKVEDQERRYGREWIAAAYRQAFQDFLDRGDRPSRWDLLHHAEKHLAGWVRAEELRREEADTQLAKRAERQPLTPEQEKHQELMRKAIGIWVRGGRRGEVPTDVNDLSAWIEANANEQRSAP